ncbi:MAG: LexA family protein [Flavitalea sp.]
MKSITAAENQGVMNIKPTPGHRIDMDISNMETKYQLLEMEVMTNVMEEEGINIGDRLVISEGKRAADGQIIIAKLNGELLLRKLQTDGIQVRLLPGGSKLAPLEIDTRFCRFEVVGVVTHVIKKLV